MKEKIIAAIKAKWPAVNLRKKRIDDISARLEAKIADENEIDAKLDELDAIFPFADIAKQDDAFAEAERKAKQVPPKNETPAPPKKEETETPKEDEAPSWAKALMDKVDRLEKNKTSEDLLTQYRAKANEIKDETMKAEKIKAFEDIVEFLPAEKAALKIAELDEFVPKFNQQLNDNALKGGSPAMQGMYKVDKEKLTIAEENYIKSLKPQVNE